MNAFVKTTTIEELQAMFGNLERTVEGLEVSRLGNGKNARLFIRTLNNNRGTGLYTGPWAVTRKNDTTVTVGANRSATFPDWAIIGYDGYKFESSNDVSVTAKGYICFRVLYSGGTYNFFHEFVSDLESINDSTEIYFPLAFVDYDTVNNKFSQRNITQLQYGIINYPARFV